MPGRNVRAGLRSALRFGDTWLLAYDAGEWGGGLWITNENGTKAKRIISNNVHALIPTEDGLIVLSGLAHMGFDFGAAYVLSRPSGLTINLEHSVQLDGEPRGYAREEEGSILFTTTIALHRITKQGELTTLTYLPRWVSSLYANSVAIAPDGSIFVGMRMFVLRLHEEAARYKQEWLLPDKCRRFELGQTDCICPEK